jgi:hypothetical protein
MIVGWPKPVCSASCRLCRLLSSGSIPKSRQGISDFPVQHRRLALTPARTTTPSQIKPNPNSAAPQVPQALRRGGPHRRRFAHYYPSPAHTICRRIPHSQKTRRRAPGAPCLVRRGGRHGIASPLTLQIIPRRTRTIDFERKSPKSLTPSRHRQRGTISAGWAPTPHPSPTFPASP